MNRAVLVASIAAFAALMGACHPQPPKQASGGEDPIGDEAASSEPSGDSSSSSSSGAGDILVPPPGGVGGGSSAGVAKAAKGEAPNVASLASYLDGLHWGMSHKELTKLFTKTRGVIAKDYDAKLKKARVGPEMTAIEAERERKKAAFSRSFIEFGDHPTGYDATGIKDEYTYRNHESLMWVERQGKKRYFFFINDRLWKIYDEVPLAEGGPLGKAYLDAVNKLNAQLGTAGRVQGADDSKGITATTVDWKDGSSHLRVVDRSGERLVGLVLEDRGTLGNLASLRPNKAVDPTAIDPTIAAVTTGGLSDPNAAKKPDGKPGKKGSKKSPKKKK